MSVFAYGPAILRLALGAVFAAHGAQKLFGLWGGGGLRDTAASFSAFGVDRPLLAAFQAIGLGSAGAASFVAGFVACLELAGGLLLIGGLLTRWAAAALAVEMAVAAYAVHLRHGFFLNWSGEPGVGHGVEMNLVLIGGLMCLMFTGAGALSIDDWRQASQEAAALGRARLRSKVH
jgi:putative oxidoreductase